MESLKDALDSVYTHLWPWVTPALKSMHIDTSGCSENSVMLQFYTWESLGSDDQSWWRHFEDEVPHLKGLGITHVWLPPMAKAASGKRSVGYDVYDLWDLGEFDQKGGVATRWGTKAELIQACKVAEQHGLNVIVDVILNHRMGGDREETCMAAPVDPMNRLAMKGPFREIQAWTAFDFPGRSNQHSSFKWNHRHFSGTDWDAKTKTKGVFYIHGPTRKGWSNNVAKELGNYDYLMGCNVDVRHPEVQQDLLAWSSWVLRETGAGGFRVDAMKHYDYKFLRSFLDKTKKATDKPSLFAVSEFWSGDIKVLENYVDNLRGQSSFFDVPLHFKFHNASKLGDKFDLREIAKDTLVDRRPFDAVTFVDNHDTEPGQSLESWVDSNFKLQAYAFILLRPHGFPCVFYGDLYPNKEWYNSRVGEGLRKLITARKVYGHGVTIDYFQHRDCIGFVRTGMGSRRGCAVVMRSAKRQEKLEERSTNSQLTEQDPERKSEEEERGSDRVTEIRMKVPLHNRLSHIGNDVLYRDFLDAIPLRVRVSKDGWATFPCPEGGVAVWVPED